MNPIDANLAPNLDRPEFVFDDGGRSAAGFKGQARDCVARSVAIASGRPYAEVYARLAAGRGAQPATSRTPKRSASARDGINTSRAWFKAFMVELGFRWVPTLRVGQAQRAYLLKGQLPPGRLVVALRKHCTAMVDGILHDTFDPSAPSVWIEPGKPPQVKARCVYGYWVLDPCGMHGPDGQLFI